MRALAVFDIGSTNFRYALGSTDGQLLTDVRAEPTDHHDLVSQILDAVRELRTEGRELDAVSISCAGLVDSGTGHVRLVHTPDGEAVRDIDVATAVRKELGLRTHIRNDGLAAVIGEYVFGDGQGFDTIAHVSIGTGIGAGIVERGRLLEGERGYAGEVGYLPVLPDAELDSAGVRGAWEAYCSGRGLEEYVEHLLAQEDRETRLNQFDTVGPEALFEAANEGDAVANEYLDEVARFNAVGIGTVANFYDPGLITLGGGVVLNNSERILDGIRRHVDDYLLNSDPEIQVTELGDEIGIYGAMALPDWDG